MRTKEFNSQVFLELACYVVFAAALLYLIASGRYLSYVTPRMKPYLFFAAVVMLLWAALSVSGLFTPQYRKRTAHCFVLAIPVLLLLLPHGEIGLSNLTGSTGLITGSALNGPPAPGDNGGGAPVLLDGGDKTEPSGTPSTPTAAAPTPAGTPPSSPEEIAPPVTTAQGAPEVPETPAVSAPASGAPGVYMSTDVYGEPLELHGYDEANRTVTVSDEEFYPWLSEFFMHLEAFDGFQVTMTGAVYKDPEFFAENEFVPARLMMSCCVADLAPTGIVCNYDKVSELAADSWITVTGTLYKGQYEGNEEPQIKVASIAPAEPVEGYLYPF